MTWSVKKGLFLLLMLAKLLVPILQQTVATDEFLSEGDRETTTTITTTGTNTADAVATTTTHTTTRRKTVVVDSQDGSVVVEQEDEQQSLSLSNNEKDNELLHEPNGRAKKKARQTTEIAMIYGTFELLESLPHNISAFTQGLSFCNGHLYQGTGLHGSSSIQKLDPDNPSVVLQSYDLSSKYFGEGITYYTNGNGQGRFLQLTWKERTAIVYNVSNIMKPLFRFRYHAVTSNGEGWGITFDALRHEFTVSDGSDQLFFWDASFLDNCERNLLLAENKSDTVCDDEITLCDILTMEPKRSIKVRVILDGDTSNTGPIPVRYLNELELIRDDETGTSSVLANVWFQNCIIEIDPNTGNVVKLYDLSSLCPERHPRGENVLNGISVSDEGGRIVYVTGKQWPYLYKIKLL